MNFLRKFSVMLLIVAMVAAVMCGCSNNTNDATNNTTEATKGEETYTVKIVDQTGAPVVSVILQLTDAKGETSLAVTDANGTVSVTSATAMDMVTLSSIPSGYVTDEVPTSVKFNGETELTITLVAEEVQNNNVTYTVTILDQNGAAVPGVTIQLCDDENCKLPVVTDENGVAVCTYEEAEYHVTLTELPDGYSSETREFLFNGATELTIVINAD